VNSKDLIGRTPLFLAARLNLRREVKALLAAKANPLIRTSAGKTPYQVCNSKKIKSFILKASLLTICIPMIPTQH
jgi:ankyrin repeat protein